MPEKAGLAARWQACRQRKAGRTMSALSLRQQDFQSRPAYADLGAELANDPKAPKSNARLIDYLNHQRHVDGELLDEVIAAWKAARRAAQ
jgi:hypothetical protein